MVSAKQLQVWLLLFVCYVAFYINRANYNTWFSALVKSGADVSQVGLFGSVFEVLCGVCKVFGGVVVDSSRPRVILCVSLVVCAACNAAMFVGPTWLSLSLWGVNGLFQGFGWPAMIAVLFHVFPDPAQRGTWYSVLSTSQSSGSAVTPIILTLAVSNLGWLAAVRVPAAIGLMVAAVVFLGLRVLVPDMDAARPSPATATKPTPSTVAAASTPSTSKPSIWKDVVLNATIWRIGVAYFFISIIRTGVASTAVLLLSTRSDAQDGVPVTCQVLLDTGALTGGLFAGYVSDKLFHGRRGPLMVLSSTALTVVLGFGLFNATTLPAVALYVVFFCVGCFAFVPHMLYGLLARENCPPQFMSTAGGLVKGVAQLGGAVAGYPLGALAEVSWTHVLHVFWTSAALSATAIAVGTVDRRYKQE